MKTVDNNISIVDENSAEGAGFFPVYTDMLIFSFFCLFFLKLEVLMYELKKHRAKSGRAVEPTVTRFCWQCVSSSPSLAASIYSLVKQPVCS